MKALSGAVLLLVLCGILYSEQTAALTVNIINIKNMKGDIKISLFNQSEGFPTKPDRAYRTMSVEITGKDQAVVFENLEYGEYAVSVLHDENKNGKMDFSWFRMRPAEGTGVSNNAKGKMGPPEYSDAKFRLNTSSEAIKIALSY